MPENARDLALELAEQAVAAPATRHWCRWEYRAEVFMKPDGTHDARPDLARYSARINRLGEQGWEVYSLAPGVVHLKRMHYVCDPRDLRGDE